METFKKNYLKEVVMQGFVWGGLNFSNCGTETLQTNVVINSFKEKQKFTLGNRKCEINCERKEKYWKV